MRRHRTVRRPARAIILILAMQACTDALETTGPPGSGFLVVNGPSESLIPGRYIVTLKRNADRAGDIGPAIAAEHGGEFVRSWHRVMNGFVLKSISEEAAAAIAGRTDVVMVEQDSRMTIAIDSQSVAGSAEWGLDRLDQRSTLGDAWYHYGFVAANVHIYVVDTGIDDHDDLDGRIGTGWGVDADTDDCNGHGTAVASIAAGTSKGIAKSATVHPVRVTTDCGNSGNTSDIIAGIEWVAENYTNPAVLNLCMRKDGGSSSLDQAASGAINEGVVFVAGAATTMTMPARIHQVE